MFGHRRCFRRFRERHRPSRATGPRSVPGTHTALDVSGRDASGDSRRRVETSATVLRVNSAVQSHTRAHPLDARLEFLSRAPNARATPRLRPGSRRVRTHTVVRFPSFAKSARRTEPNRTLVRRVHLICSTDRPGGRDCLSLFALLASSTHSVYKYFEQRTLNLVRVPVFLIFTLLASLRRAVRRKSLISLICLGCGSWDRGKGGERKRAGQGPVGTRRLTARNSAQGTWERNARVPSRENRVGSRARRGASRRRDRRADADNRSRRVRARFLPLAGREAVPTPEIRRGARRATRDAEPNPKLRFFASAGRRPNGTDGDVGRDAGTDGDGGRTIFCFPNRALLACASLKGPPGGRGSVDGARKNSSPRTSRGWRPRFSVLYVCISSLKMSGSYAFNCASSTYW